MYRYKKNKYISSEQVQDNIQDLLLQFDTRLSNYEKMGDFLKDVTDNSLQKVHQKEKFELIKMMRYLIGRGINYYEFISKFGQRLLLANMINAQKTIDEQQKSNDHFKLGDFVNEDEFAFDDVQKRAQEEAQENKQAIRQMNQYKMPMTLLTKEQQEIQQLPDFIKQYVMNIVKEKNKISKYDEPDQPLIDQLQNHITQEIKQPKTINKIKEQQIKDYIIERQRVDPLFDYQSYIQRLENRYQNDPQILKLLKGIERYVENHKEEEKKVEVPIPAPEEIGTPQIEREEEQEKVPDEMEQLPRVRTSREQILDAQELTKPDKMIVYANQYKYLQDDEIQELFDYLQPVIKNFPSYDTFAKFKVALNKLKYPNSLIAKVNQVKSGISSSNPQQQ